MPAPQAEQRPTDVGSSAGQSSVCNETSVQSQSEHKRGTLESRETFQGKEELWSARASSQTTRRHSGICSDDVAGNENGPPPEWGEVRFL
jgi:hypothetical protein